MCGIAGILKIHKPGEEVPPPRVAIPESSLDILDESLKHRGPDGQGRFRDRAVREDGTVVDIALVHRRLSIIDHEGGAQPMVIGPSAQNGAPSASERVGPSISREGQPYTDWHGPACPCCGKGRVAVVFNGCIYNHRELRKELEAAGHVFSSDHSDTETIIHGWCLWREDLFERLKGMFAFAVWESDSGSLHLSRDFYGQKPLYFFLDPNPFEGPVDEEEQLLVFNSLTPALTRLLSETPNEPSEQSRVIRYQWVRRGYARHCGYNQVRQIATHASVAARKHIHVDNRFLPNATRARQQTPSLASVSDRKTVPDQDLVEQLICDAVERRLESDVPIGCLLSSGIDSSLICAIASRSVEKLHTFTVRMPDSRFDESPAAKRIAAHLGTVHQTLDCEPNAAHDLVALIHRLGLPFGDSSLLPTYWVCAAARKEVKVVLTGDGGDELFAGYQRYHAAGLLWRASIVFKHLPASLLSRRSPRSRTDKLARFIRAARYNGYHDLLAIFPTELWRNLIKEQSEPTLGEKLAQMPLSYRLFLWLGAVIAKPLQWKGISEAIESDIETYLPDDLLRKVDLAAMSVGLETRCPFLDSDLAAEIRWAVPKSLMPNGQLKGLLRAIARKYLPPEIVDRPKMGFAIPIGEWFRSDYGGMRQLLYDHLQSTDPFPGLADAGVNINMDFVQQMLCEHDAAGEKSLWPWRGRDHSQRLYMLLVLSIWAKWMRGIGIRQ